MKILVVLLLMITVSLAQMEVVRMPSFLTTKLILEGKPPTLQCATLRFKAVDPPKDYAPGEDLFSYMGRTRPLLLELTFVARDPQMAFQGLLATTQLDPQVRLALHHILTLYPHPTDIKLHELSPGMCDPLIRYFYPRKVATPAMPPMISPPPPQIFGPYTGPFAVIATLYNDFVFKNREILMGVEYKIYSQISEKLNSFIESFYGSMQSYTYEMTYEMLGKTGKLKIDLPKVVNIYSSDIHSFRTSGDTTALQRLVYIFLTGYRAKGVKYSKNPVENAWKNLEIISSWELAYPPLIFQGNTRDIDFWISVAGVGPVVNPAIVDFLSAPPLTYSPPLSVLDAPVFLQMLLTHDSLQDTLFTSFLLSFLEGGKIKWDIEEETKMIAWRQAFLQTMASKEKDFWHRYYKPEGKSKEDTLRKAQEKAKERAKRLFTD